MGFAACYTELRTFAAKFCLTVEWTVENLGQPARIPQGFKISRPKVWPWANFLDQEAGTGFSGFRRFGTKVIRGATR